MTRAKITAPRRVLLYCNQCRASHPFTRQSNPAGYTADCGKFINIQTLLATYASVLDRGFEEFAPPLELILED